MDEIYKEIPGYEGIYEVSNLGNVRSVQRNVRSKAVGGRTVAGKQKSVLKDAKGTRIVQLFKDNKKSNVSVDRLVRVLFTTVG